MYYSSEVNRAVSRIPPQIVATSRRPPALTPLSFRPPLAGCPRGNTSPARDAVGVMDERSRMCSLVARDKELTKAGGDDRRVSQRRKSRDENIVRDATTRFCARSPALQHTFR